MKPNPDILPLLPCPFCGKHAEIHDSRDAGGPVYFWASCESCCAQGAPQVSPEDAAFAWNERKTACRVPLLAADRYRRATDSAFRCAACVHFRDGGPYRRLCKIHTYGPGIEYCVTRNAVCDKFAPNRKETRQ